jgi:hypothetical protein
MIMLLSRNGKAHGASMIVHVELAFVDVRADALSLVYGAPIASALAAVSATRADNELELRLLGCSHQAVVNDGAFCETVSCQTGISGYLPHHARHSAAQGSYAFNARIEKLTPREYSAVAGRVIEAVATDDAGLVGIFAGPADAFTALQVRPPDYGLAWRTWHGYPQTSELVITETHLERAP